jgi:predicted aldo/keto reductase-like oxidoreductase
MSKFTRRDFFRTTATAGALAGLGANLPIPAPAAPAKRSATDWVTLGTSGVKVTRLAFGTGTRGGSVQRELGQEQFTKLVRYAYDQGIRFFETADAYRGMPEMLGIALKGLPRDSYRVMTKYRLNTQEDPNATIDRFRRELQSEYLDILLLHCVRTPTWSADFERLRDAFSERKDKKIIAAHGASCHGLLPLRAFPGNQWLDVSLNRINHRGNKMDSMNTRDSDELGNVDEVTLHLDKIHKQGTGVLGMKIIGEGQFKTPEDRDKSIRYVMQLGTVDAVTIGFKNTQEIDEAIQRINTHLNS